MRKKLFPAATWASVMAGTALATVMLGTTLVAPAGAADKAAGKNGLTEDLMKVSDDGYAAVRAIHLARIAIFNGDTKAADQMLDKAKKDLDEATKDGQKFAADEKAANQGKGAVNKSEQDKQDKHDLIPIDGEIAIADTFVPSTTKQSHIEKANEHLKSGHSREALEELRLGEVDVVFTRVMLPLEATKKRVADAEKMVNDHKYYEANLALKAAEDSIVIDAIDLLGTPKAAATASTATTPKK